MRFVVFLILAFFACTSANVVAAPPGGVAEPLSTQPEIVAEQANRTKAAQWMSGINPEYVGAVLSTPDSPASRKTLEAILAKPDNHPYASWIIVQKLAGFEMQSGQFMQAVGVWQKYSYLFPGRQAEIQELLRMLIFQEGSKIRNLGPLVNSTANDYLPVPELSGQKLYFTSLGRKGGSGQEDIWVTTMGPNGWSKAEPLDDLNTDLSESPDGLSADGTVMSVYGNYKGSFGNGDVFQSQLTVKGWSSLVHLPSPINTQYFESDTNFTPDGAVIFASDRPNGYFQYRPVTQASGGFLNGNTDMYVAFKKPDGSWTTPRNLGPFINTPGAERTPFLYPDGKTLYFSSDGYNGFGRSDVYKSVRLDDTWLHWSKPVNLGPLVNGPGQDWGFRMTAASDRGYFSGELSGTLGGQDIYEVVPLPIAARPATVAVGIRGVIKDENAKPTDATVEWQDLATGKSLGVLATRPGSGEFFIALPAGREYAYFAKKSGYLNQSERVDLRSIASYEEQKVEMQLISIASARKSGAEIVLNNIFFEYGSDALNPRSFAELDRLVGILKQDPQMNIEVQGHTDSTGDPTFNNVLSGKRAEAVASYLRTAGVPGGQIRVKGYGSTKSVAPNTTEQGRQRNRRVSFIVLGTP
ncbi:MAG: OmpA family protein [Spirochaetia bacterium]|nr:OmpA family protein [Spirochaetia bacterium]